MKRLATIFAFYYFIFFLNFVCPGHIIRVRENNLWGNLI